MGWSKWKAVPQTSNATSGPAVASWDKDRLDAFWRGADGTLQHAWWSAGGWKGTESLRDPIQEAPAAVSWAVGRIDVFSRGMDSVLLHRWYDRAFGGPETLSDVLTSSPAVASSQPGRLDVFARGSDNLVHHKVYDVNDPPFKGWDAIAGPIKEGPAAVPWGVAYASSIILFARRLDDRLVQNSWDGTKFSGWSPIEAPGAKAIYGGGPAVVSWGFGRLDVFARVRSNNQVGWPQEALGHWWLEASLGSTGSWQYEDLDLPVYSILGSPSAVSWGPGRIDVLITTQEKKLEQLTFDT